MKEGLLIVVSLFLAWGFWFYADNRCTECTTDSECEAWCGKEH
jgi:hypothetical protein